MRRINKITKAPDQLAPTQTAPDTNNSRSHSITQFFKLNFVWMNAMTAINQVLNSTSPVKCKHFNVDHLAFQVFRIAKPCNPPPPPPEDLSNPSQLLAKN